MIIFYVLKIIKRALVIQTENIWFKDDGQLTKVLCESGIY